LVALREQVRDLIAPIARESLDGCAVAQRWTYRCNEDGYFPYGWTTVATPQDGVVAWMYLDKTKAEELLSQEWEPNRPKSAVDKLADLVG
jgi:hypothetical protein